MPPLVIQGVIIATDVERQPGTLIVPPKPCSKVTLPVTIVGPEAGGYLALLIEDTKTEGVDRLIRELTVLKFPAPPLKVVLLPLFTNKESTGLMKAMLGARLIYQKERLLDRNLVSSKSSPVERNAVVR